MWIRSQNENMLIKARQIRYVKTDNANCLYVGDLDCVGKYSSKTRCLAILKEIENCILKSNGYFCDNVRVGGNGQVVYLMPKE